MLNWHLNRISIGLGGQLMSEPASIPEEAPTKQVWKELASDKQVKAIQLMAQLAFNLIESKGFSDANNIANKQD